MLYFVKVILFSLCNSVRRRKSKLLLLKDHLITSTSPNLRKKDTILFNFFFFYMLVKMMEAIGLVITGIRLILIGTLMLSHAKLI